MRIAFCVPELSWLGPVSNGQLSDAAHLQQEYIAAGLLGRGHSLTYIAPHGLDQVVCTDDIQQLRVAPRTWTDKRWFDMASKGAWHLQRRLGFPYLNLFSNYCRYDACRHCLPGHDLVHERNGLFNAGVAMACKRLGLPYIVFFDADQIAELDFLGEPVTGLLRWRARQILNYNLSVADCIICVSKPAQSQLMTEWRVPKEKIVVFSNGVDVQRFRPCPERRSSMRAAYGIANEPLIIFVGSFHRWHDVETLLDAFARLVTKNTSARLFLVGDGYDRLAMVQYADALGIGGSVDFTGHVAHSDMPDLMMAADVAVAPVPVMDRDLWLSPMKLFEYMASGLATVASDVGQLADVVQDGYNGLLVPPGDADTMANALQRLVDDPALRTRIGQQARNDAVRKHSWERYSAGLERLYTAVIAGEPVSML